MLTIYNFWLFYLMLPLLRKIFDKIREVPRINVKGRSLCKKRVQLNIFWARHRLDYSSNELAVAFRRKNISFWSYLFYHYTISACQYSLWQQFQQFYVIPSVQINNKRLTYIQSEKRRKKYLLTRTDLWQTFYDVFQEDKETYEFLFLVDYECMRSFFTFRTRGIMK